jgi:hypothetical protein
MYSYSIQYTEVYTYKGTESNTWERNYGTGKRRDKTELSYPVGITFCLGTHLDSKCQRALTLWPTG